MPCIISGLSSAAAQQYDPFSLLSSLVQRKVEVMCPLVGLLSYYLLAYQHCRARAGKAWRCMLQA